MGVIQQRNAEKRQAFGKIADLIRNLGQATSSVNEPKNATQLAYTLNTVVCSKLRQCFAMVKEHGRERHA